MTFVSYIHGFGNAQGTSTPAASSNVVGTSAAASSQNLYRANAISTRQVNWYKTYANPLTNNSSQGYITEYNKLLQALTEIANVTYPAGSGVVINQSQQGFINFINNLYNKVLTTPAQQFTALINTNTGSMFNAYNISNTELYNRIKNYLLGKVNYVNSMVMSNNQKELGLMFNYIVPKTNIELANLELSAAGTNASSTSGSNANSNTQTTTSQGGGATTRPSTGATGAEGSNGSNNTGAKPGGVAVTDSNSFKNNAMFYLFFGSIGAMALWFLFSTPNQKPKYYDNTNSK